MANLPDCTGVAVPLHQQVENRFLLMVLREYEYIYKAETEMEVYAERINENYHSGHFKYIFVINAIIPYMASGEAHCL